MCALLMISEHDVWMDQWMISHHREMMQVIIKSVNSYAKAQERRFVFLRFLRSFLEDGQLLT